MRDLCRKFQISSVEHITALIALYRPGPMELIPEFIKRRQGEVTITVKGKVDQGKAQVSEVEVTTGGQATRYDSLDKVPAEHRERARKLADMASGGRGVRPKAKQVF